MVTRQPIRMGVFPSSGGSLVDGLAAGGYGPEVRDVDFR